MTLTLDDIASPDELTGQQPSTSSPRPPAGRTLGLNDILGDNELSARSAAPPKSGTLGLSDILNPAELQAHIAATSPDRQQWNQDLASGKSQVLQLPSTPPPNFLARTRANPITHAPIPIELPQNTATLEQPMLNLLANPGQINPTTLANAGQYQNLLRTLAATHLADVQRAAQTAQNEKNQQQQAVEQAGQESQQNLENFTAQHPVLGNALSIAEAVHQGAAGSVAGAAGLVNPQFASQAEQGLPITSPTLPGTASEIGKAVGGSILPVATAVVNPLAGAAMLGAQGAGQTRADIAGLREQGQNISGNQELASAAGQGVVQTGLGLALGGAGKFLDGAFASLAPEAQAALRAGDATVLQNITHQALNLAGKSVSGASVAEAINTASNLIKQGYDPKTALTEGWQQNGILGAILPHVMPGHEAESAGPSQPRGEQPSQTEQSATPSNLLAEMATKQALANRTQNATPESTPMNGAEHQRIANPEQTGGVSPAHTEAQGPNMLQQAHYAQAARESGETFTPPESKIPAAMQRRQGQVTIPALSDVSPEAARDIRAASDTLKKGGANIADALDRTFPVEGTGLKGLFGKNTTDAEDAKLALRSGMNSAMNEHQGALESLSHVESAFDKMPIEEQRAFQAGMYDKTVQATPELQSVADSMFKITNERRKQLADLGVEAAKDWDENHWNMLWKKDPDAAATLRDRIYGAGKLGGKAGWLKARTPGDFESKLRAGLVPVEDNPLKQFALTDESQRRFIGMGRAIRGLGERGAIFRTDDIPDAHSDITNILPRSFRDFIAGEGEKIAAPDDVAKLIKNVIQPSWFEGGPVRREIKNTLRATNNFLTQLALGVSGFHLKKVFGLEQPAMNAAEGRMSLLEGLPGRAERAINIQRSMMGLQDMLDPVHRQIIDALKNNMTATHEKFYDTNISTNLAKSIAKRDAWAGLKDVIKTPFALNQKLMQDVIFKSVQRAKLSYAFDSLHQFISDHPNASTHDIQREAARISDHADNILGLMNRDNLLWNRTARDIASLSMMSVGWNYGTLRSLGGAAAELGHGVGRAWQNGPSLPDLFHSGDYRQMKYWLTSLTMAGAYGVMKTYLKTGHAPQSVADVMFPTTGKKDQQGRDVRENTGSYANDIYDLLTNPAGTIAGKLSPIMHLMGDLATNRDYQGHQILNHNDPLTTQGDQLAKYLVTQHLEPLSIRNIVNKFERATTPVGRIQAIVGGLFGRQAPISVSESSAEKKIHELLTNHGDETPEEVDHQRLISDFAQQLQQHAPIWKPVRDAIKAGGLRPGDMEVIEKRARGESGITGLLERSNLAPADLMQVWGKMTPDERQANRWVIRRRIAASSDILPAQRRQYFDQISADLKKQ